jgi:hypothetical protein
MYANNHFPTEISSNELFFIADDGSQVASLSERSSTLHSQTGNPIGLRNITSIL